MRLVWLTAALAMAGVLQTQVSAASAPPHHGPICHGRHCIHGIIIHHCRHHPCRGFPGVVVHHPPHHVVGVPPGEGVARGNPGLVNGIPVEQQHQVAPAGGGQ